MKRPNSSLLCWDAVMAIVKFLPVLALMLCCSAQLASANGEIVPLPTFKSMAESELRAEAGVIPYQQDENIRKALQHRIIQLQGDTQAFVVDPTVTQNLEVLAPAPEPALDTLPPLLREHVLNIASGLQSSDPTEGLYIMLQPFGIDRGASNVQLIREQISIGQIDFNSQPVLPQNMSLPQAPPFK